MYHSTDLLTSRGVAHLVVHGTSGSTSYEMTLPVRLETSGDVLPTVDMVVQRRDGPRELDDDDDDDKISTDTARSICVSTELHVLLVSKLTGGRPLCWRTVRCETLRQQEAARSQA